MSIRESFERAIGDVSTFRDAIIIKYQVGIETVQHRSVDSFDSLVKAFDSFKYSSLQIVGNVILLTAFCGCRAVVEFRKLEMLNSNHFDSNLIDFSKGCWVLTDLKNNQTSVFKSDLAKESFNKIYKKNYNFCEIKIGDVFAELYAEFEDREVFLKLEFVKYQ